MRATRPRLLLIGALVVGGLAILAWMREWNGAADTVHPPARLGEPPVPHVSTIGPVARREEAADDEETFIIAGTVVSEDGRRLAGVRFSIRSPEILSESAADSLRASALLVGVESSGNGTFQSQPLASGTWVLNLSSAEWCYADGLLPVVRSEPGQRVVDVRIVLAKESACFIGILETHDGVPIANEQVAASGIGLLMNARTDEGGQFLMRPSSASSGRVVEVVDVLMENGRGYQFRGRWPTATTPYRFVLPRPATIIVTFAEEAGRPIDLFSAQIVPLTPNTMPLIKVEKGTMETRVRHGKIATSVGGVVEFGDLMPGSYLIACRRAAVGMESMQVVEVAAGDQHRILVKEPPAVSVQVFGAKSGDPVAGAEVRVGSLITGDPRARPWWVRLEDLDAQIASLRVPLCVVVGRGEALTDQAGKASVPLGEPGTQGFIQVKAEGFISVFRPVESEGEQTIRLKESVNVAGRILGWEALASAMDLEGAAAFARLVGDASVVVPAPEGALLPSAGMVRADGAFSIRGLHAGSWELLLVAPRNRLVLGEFMAPSAGEVVIDGNKVSWSPVRFLVETPKPLSGVRVGVHSNDGTKHPTRWLDTRGGRTQRVNLLQGQTKVVVTSPDGLFPTLLREEVWVAGEDEVVHVLRVPYREALVELGSGYADRVFAAVEERHAIPGPADFKLRARDGAVRVRWAPTQPFWLRAPATRTGEPDTILGPFRAGEVGTAGR